MVVDVGDDPAGSVNLTHFAAQEFSRARHF